MNTCSRTVDGCIFVTPGSQALSLLTQDLRETHLQVLLFSGQRSSNNNTTNISVVPLQHLGFSFSTSDVEKASKSTIFISDDYHGKRDTCSGAEEAKRGSKCRSKQHQITVCARSAALYYLGTEIKMNACMCQFAKTHLHHQSC